MSVEIDWNDPDVVETMLAKEWLWIIKEWTKEQVNNSIDITSANIEHKKEGNYIYFYFNDEIVGFINYFMQDEYLQFIGNINWCNWNLKDYAENPLIAGIFQESGNLEIPGLWKYMLEIFFSEFCISWQEIKMRIENPKVRSILNGLKEKRIINDYWDVKWVPSETIIKV